MHAPAPAPQRPERPLRRLLLLGALLAAPAAGQEPGPEPAADPPLSVRVNRAIARGVRHLEERQAADGTWPGDETRYPGGLTAFAAYTLRKSGLRPSAPPIARALAALRGIPFRSTYGAAARLFLYESLEDPALLAEARACADFLVEGQTGGLWAYPWDQPDMSNVQFALFALRAARALGVEVPDDVFVSCAEAIWRWYDERGAFRYREDRIPTAGVTAATLAGVAVLEELGLPAVDRALKKRRRERAAAEEWLAERFDPARNVHGEDSWTPGFHHAYLWAVERYGDLAGRPLLGTHDWYDAGAEWLVATQGQGGGWGKTEDTCFALLFLRRAALSGGRELAEVEARADAAWRSELGPPEPRPAPGLPWLDDWLLAGPWAGAPEATGLDAPPFDPARVRVEPKGRLGRERWERVRLKADGWTDLEQVTGRGVDHGLWALGTRLAVPPEAGELACALWLDLEDGWRVLLDGAEVSADRRVGAAIEGDVRVDLSLAPGVHELLVLAEDVYGASAFGARLGAPDGTPLATPIAVGPDADETPAKPRGKER